MSDWMGLVWLVVLLIANAFFVAAEFAVISARRSQIEPLALKGKQSAKTALWAMEHATLMLATSQLGITVCSLLILNVSEPAIHHLLQYPLELIGLPDEFVSTVAFVIALLIVSFLHVVFGEMVPKNLAFSVPDRSVLLLAPPLVWVANAFRWLIFSLNAVANGVLRLFGVEPKNEATSSFTLDEVATIVSQSTREGVLVDNSGTLSAAFEFTEKTVENVAVPVDKIISLPVDTTPNELEQMVAKYGFSRYLLQDEQGQAVGYLHIKDVLDLADAQAEIPVPKKRIRQLSSLLVGTELEDALAKMRKTGAHLSLVIDEAQTTVGILFLEDVIEELVGEVHDATRRVNYDLD